MQEKKSKQLVNAHHEYASLHLFYFLTCISPFVLSCQVMIIMIFEILVDIREEGLFHEGGHNKAKYLQG